MSGERLTPRETGSDRGGALGKSRLIDGGSLLLLLLLHLLIHHESAAVVLVVENRHHAAAAAELVTGFLTIAAMEAINQSLHRETDQEVTDTHTTNVMSVFSRNV